MCVLSEVTKGRPPAGGALLPLLSGGGAWLTERRLEVQVVQEAAQPLERYYRHISEGAWPFSTRDHGWPISDCTSEVRSHCHCRAPHCPRQSDFCPDTGTQCGTVHRR